MTRSARPRKERLIAAWAQAWEDGNMVSLDAMLSPDYRRHVRMIQEQTRVDLFSMIDSTRVAFPDLATTIEDVIEDGDRMAIRWRMTATHTGHLLGVPPTGKSVTVVGIDFTRFDGDLIVEEWVTWDPGELLYNLGIISLGEV
jgi:steroid delta-isomerase-like uncharacterized protein